MMNFPLFYKKDIWLIKKYQKKKVEVVEELKSPIERATILLKTLEKKELWQKGAV